LGVVLFYFIFILVKPHIEAGAINNIIDKAMEDNYMLESIWKVAEIAVMSIAPFGINRPTMRQVVSGLREAIEIQTNMQSSYDVSSVSMQSNACFAPTIAKPTTTTTIFKVLAHLSNACPTAVKETICKQISRLAQATQMLWTSHMPGRRRRR
jgi:hypothetical protein